MRASVSAGDRFGRLVVVSAAAKSRTGRSRFLCECSCGQQRIVFGSALRAGLTKSCGCIRRETAAALGRRRATHGETRGGVSTREYSAWIYMNRRCYDDSHPDFKKYGALGVTVCAEWRAGFEPFLAHMGRRPSDDHSVERIDPNGNYEPGNVKWATRLAQARNKRNTHRETHPITGERLSISEWAERHGIKSDTLVWRLNHGFTLIEALTQPVRRRRQEASQ